MSYFNRGNNTTGGNNNPGNKPVCKFYLQGRCRYGDQCHNYHPPRDGSSTSNQSLPYHLSRDGVKGDLTYGEDRPTWPLSAYGPGKDAPRQLIEGQLELSPEEMRVQYYLAKASGNTQQYEQTEASALAEANQRAQKILSDLDGALKYVVDGKDVHPNREDMVQKPSGNFTWVEKPVYKDNSSSSNGTTFGQPSTFGNNATTAFGQTSGGSTFGQPSAPSPFGKPSAPSTFGAPSALGSGGSAFGKPSPLGGGSLFGQAGASTGGTSFGQPSNPGASTFGKPSAPGTGSAFGQPSSLGGGSAFGRPSPFGAAAGSSTSAFGQSGFGSNATPAFGQSSTPGQQQSPFGQAAPSTSTFGKPSFGAQSTPAFGQASQPGPATSTFGQPSQPAQPTSVFGQPSQPSAFGQPSQPGQQPSPFGQASQTGQQQSTFDQPSAFGNANGTGTSAFGQSSFSNAALPKPSTFGQPATTGQQQSPFAAAKPSTFGSNGASATPNPFAAAQPSTSNPAPARTPGQPLTSFKGQRVFSENDLPFYNNPQTGKKERIWMPDGMPGPNPDAEAPPEVYEALGPALKEVYDYVRERGRFKDGWMPEVPPKREWVGWEL